MNIKSTIINYTRLGKRQPLPSRNGFSKLCGINFLNLSSLVKKVDTAGCRTFSSFVRARHNEAAAESSHG
jgi:hypothetical protein